MSGLGFAASLPVQRNGRHNKKTSNITTGAGLQPVAVLSSRRTRRSENATGDIFVDSSCIDCDTCRWLAPATFQRENGQSAVYTQPADEATRLLALAAAAACPTSSIRSESEKSAAVKYGKEFPMAVENLPNSTNAAPGVYYLGMTSEDSFAASSWLIVEEDGTGVMVDVPRYSESMAKRIEALCDKLTMVLTHRDDVAGHDRWAKRMNAKRIIHEDEANARQGTDECEIQLTNAQFPYKLKDGFELVHLPGHTVGCIVLVHERTRSLFSGDHLLFSHRTGSLLPSPQFTWYSWQVLSESMEKTAELPFLHVWPGHGRHHHFKDDSERVSVLREVVKTMRNM